MEPADAIASWPVCGLFGFGREGRGEAVVSPFAATVTRALDGAPPEHVSAQIPANSAADDVPWGQSADFAKKMPQSGPDAGPESSLG